MSEAPAISNVRHVLQSIFNGRRIVIFSRSVKTDDPAIIDEVRAISTSGGSARSSAATRFNAIGQRLDRLAHMIRIYKREAP